MKARNIIFEDKKGRKIVGILNMPKGAGPFPAVVICHGFKGYKEQLHLKSLAEKLAKDNILSLRFDFGNGVGKSYGKLEDIKFSQYLDDLKSAVDYLTKQSFVDAKRIALVGHSLGGQLILHYASTDKRIKVLVDLAGVVLRGVEKTNIEKNVKNQMKQAKKLGYFYIFSKRTGKKYRIKIDYYFDLLKHDTPAQIKKIKLPVLIVHGSKDDTVSLSHSKLAYRLLNGPKKLTVIPGAPHTWRGSDDPGNKFQKKINPLVADWFNRYL